MGTPWFYGEFWPVVQVVSGEHCAVGRVEVQPPDPVGVQQVHETEERAAEAD